MLAVHTKTHYRFPIRRTGGAPRNDLKSEQKKQLLADEGISISNDRKLAFMKIIFSKLDPRFIESMILCFVMEYSYLLTFQELWRNTAGAWTSPWTISSRRRSCALARRRKKGVPRVLLFHFIYYYVLHFRLSL
jgi:hypothetical protein